MDINLNALAQFRPVVAARGFTQAAEILGVARPAVSINIKKLEGSPGMILPNRSPFRHSSLAVSLNRLAPCTSANESQSDLSRFRGSTGQSYRIPDDTDLGSVYDRATKFRE